MISRFDDEARPSGQRAASARTASTAPGSSGRPSSVALVHPRARRRVDRVEVALDAQVVAQVAPTTRASSCPSSRSAPPRARRRRRSRTSSALASFHRCSESSSTPSRSKMMAAGTPGACRRRRLGGRPTHARALRCRSEIHMDWFTNWALEWQGVFALVFMIIIATFLWRTIKLMPKTKPGRSSRTSSTRSRWDDIAGVDEAKDELREIVDFLRDPERFHKARGQGPEGHPAARPARHGQDAAREGRRARVRRPVLLPVRRVVRRDVRRPRRRPHPAAVQRGAQGRARRSSSSTSSTPSAAGAAATTTPSASRR